MPGNEFEKQVQQKMDELHFVPSEAVWKEVEKQIREPRKRRLPFLWLALFVALLGGAALLYMPGTANNKVAGTEKNTHSLAEKAKAEREKITAGATNPVQQNSTKPAAVTAARVQETEQTNAVESATKNPNDHQNPNTSSQLPGKAQHQINISNKPAGNQIKFSKAPVAMVRSRIPAINNLSNKNALAKAVNPKNKSTVLVEKPVFDEEAGAAAADKLRKEKQDDIDVAVAADSKMKQEAIAATDSVGVAAVPVNAMLVAADSAQNKEQADSGSIAAKGKSAGKTTKKIAWGFSAGIGGSNISKGFSGVFSPSYAYDAASRNNAQNNSPGTAIGNGNLNSSTVAGGLKPGLAYSLGLFINKPLGKNFNLVVGLGYSYYSMGIGVGAKIDSNKALLQFYNGSSASYTNRFHFIELPVTLEKQLGKTSRFSVNGGFSISMLAGSNALQYDVQKNIYFADNSYINKTQWGLLAGFNYRLSQKSLLVQAGPQLRYGLSNIFKPELYGNRHLFFAGINARVYMHRNKR